MIKNYITDSIGSIVIKSKGPRIELRAGSPAYFESIAGVMYFENYLMDCWSSALAVVLPLNQC